MILNMAAENLAPSRDSFCIYYYYYYYWFYE